MSKQVERQGDSLIVRTRENYTTASKVVFMQKGKTAKAFYPFIPSVISLEEAESFSICGYRVSELVKLALELNHRKLDEVDLKNYNNSFFDGYKRAQEDIQAQLEESVNKIITGFKEG